jgi:hypothetical protein
MFTTASVSVVCLITILAVDRDNDVVLTWRLYLFSNIFMASGLGLTFCRTTKWVQQIDILAKAMCSQACLCVLTGQAITAYVTNTCMSENRWQSALQ